MTATQCDSCMGMGNNIEGISAQGFLLRHLAYEELFWWRKNSRKTFSHPWLYKKRLKVVSTNWTFCWEEHITDRNPWRMKSLTGDPWVRRSQKDLCDTRGIKWPWVFVMGLKGMVKALACVCVMNSKSESDILTSNGWRNLWMDSWGELEDWNDKSEATKDDLGFRKSFCGDVGLIWWHLVVIFLLVVLTVLWVKVHWDDKCTKRWEGSLEYWDVGEVVVFWFFLSFSFKDKNDHVESFQQE